MTGQDRSWLYTLAIYTGLRRSELQSLTPESFSLDASPPTVSLPGRDTKNSDDATQPLPFHVIPALRSWLETKPSMTPLFPPDRNSSLMIKADLKAAGIPADDFDFHGLRHCYVSQIVQTGASVKDAMELARHSDADLTFNRYAHTRLEDLSRIVDKLPNLWEKCAKGDGLSVDLKSKAGTGEAIHQESLVSDFPTCPMCEENGEPIFSHTLPTSGVSSGLNGTIASPVRYSPGASQADPSRHAFELPGPTLTTVNREAPPSRGTTKFD
jgi:hypothetical protein